MIPTGGASLAHGGTSAAEAKVRLRWKKKEILKPDDDTQKYAKETRENGRKYNNKQTARATKFKSSLNRRPGSPSARDAPYKRGDGEGEGEGGELNSSGNVQEVPPPY